MKILKTCTFSNVAFTLQSILSKAGSKPQLKSQKLSDGLAGLCTQQFNFIQDKNKTTR